MNSIPARSRGARLGIWLCLLTLGGSLFSFSTKVEAANQIPGYTLSNKLIWEVVTDTDSVGRDLLTTTHECGNIACGKLLQDAWKDIVAHPPTGDLTKQKVYINDNTSFNTISLIKDSLEGPVDNKTSLSPHWASATNTIIILAAQIHGKKVRPNDPNYLDEKTENGVKTLTFNAAGREAWKKFMTDRTKIDQYVSALFKVNTVLSTPQPLDSSGQTPGLWWNQLSNPQLTKIPKAVGLKDFLKDGTLPKTAFLPYSNLFEFTNDYAMIHSMTADQFSSNTKADGTEDPKGKKVTAEDAKKALGTNVALSKDDFSIAANPAASDDVKKQDPCGTGDWAWNIGYNLQYKMCQIVVFANSAEIWGLTQSAVMLAYTGDMLPKPSTNVAALSGLFSNEFLNFMSTPVEEQLIDTEGKGSVANLVQAAYARILQFLNIALILGLLLIALANILQIQINVYAVNKLLPALIIGFIAAHFSFFATRAALEVIGQATRGLMLQGTGQEGAAGTPCDLPVDTLRPANDGIQTKLGDDKNDRVFCQFVNQFTGFPISANEIAKSGGDSSCLATQDKAWMTNTCDTKGYVDFGKMFKLSILNLFILAAATFIVILAFLLTIRHFLFFALVPIAPLAVLGAFFSPLQAVWKKWWGLIRGWLLMPLVAGFWIWLAMLWANSVATVAQSGALAPVFGYVFSLLCFYMAIKTPFSLAGEAKGVMEGWNRIGRNFANQYTPAGAARRGYGKIKNSMNEREKQILEGNVIKGSKGKFGPGRWINEGVARYEHNTKQRGERQEVDAKLIGAMAKSHDRGFQRRQAGIDKLSDNVSTLDETLKDLIKIEKNTHFRNDSLAIREMNLFGIRLREDLSKRQMRVHADFEMSETNKMVGWNRELQRDHELMRRVIAASKGEDARKKAQSEMELTHISNRSVEMGLHNNIDRLLAESQNHAAGSAARVEFQNRAIEMAQRLERFSEETDNPEKVRQYRDLQRRLRTMSTASPNDLRSLGTLSGVYKRQLNDISAEAEAIIDKRLAKAGGADDKEEGTRLMEEPGEIMQKLLANTPTARLNFARAMSGRLDEITDEKVRRDTVAQMNAIKRLQDQGKVPPELGNAFMNAIDRLNTHSGTAAALGAIADPAERETYRATQESLRRANLGAAPAHAAAKANLRTALTNRNYRTQATGIKNALTGNGVAAHAIDVNAVQLGEDVKGRPGALYTDLDVDRP